MRFALMSATALLIAGCETLPLAAYDEILVIERAARAAGYPELA